jgi:Trypsin-like peptidase domain
MKTLGITEQLVHSTVRIETNDAAGNQGSGTGFIVFLLQDGEMNVPVLVTNKHVVRDQSTGYVNFTMKGSDGLPKYGHQHRVQIPDFAQQWIPHPDPGVDLCIFPIAPLVQQLTTIGKEPFFIGVSEKALPSEQEVADLMAIEDVVMVGYPNGLWDSKNNFPIVRKGITATPPYVDYEGRSEFWIDAACFPGSSGSPVFICNQGMVILKSGTVMAGASRVYLLGVLYAGPQITTEGRIAIKPAPSSNQVMAVFDGMMNLGMCIKSARIRDFEALLRPIITIQNQSSRAPA